MKLPVTPSLPAPGANSAFTEDVLGDLAEEYALRAGRDGVWTASWWYTHQALRSAPHLIRNSVRNLGPRGRVRLAASLAGLVLASALIVIALPAGMGPPERLVASTVVVNNLESVRLPMRVLDAAGRTLPNADVRYTWTSGSPVSVSREGLITCEESGDAVVLAALGPLVTNVPVRCRPVNEIRAPGTLELILGGPGRDVPFEAVGLDGRPVTLLVGRMHIGDSTIATLEGQRIRARAPGRTWVETFIGNRATFSSVHVYGPAESPEAVRPDQLLAVPVRLAPGETREWRLPAGRYFLRVVLDRDDQPKARLVAAGARCRLFGGTHLECLARGDMSVTVRHARHSGSAPELRGTLLVWRQPEY